MLVTFVGGTCVGCIIMGIFQGNRNSEDKERAEHAIKMANYYKEKCKEMQEEARRYKNV